MARTPDFDARTADRLLSGRMAPDDAPPGFRGAARVLHEAGGPASPVRSDADLVGSMAAAIQTGPAPDAPPPARRRGVFAAKVLSAKVAAVAGVVMLSATGAAAATGSLPGPAQTGLSHAAGHLGIHLPSDDDETTATDTGDDTESDAPDTESDDESTESSDESSSSDDTGSDSESDDQSTESADEGDGDGGAAPADNHGAVVSDTAKTTPPGPDHGPTVSDVANGDHPNGEHPNGDHPTSDDHPGNEDHPTSDDHPDKGKHP